jgi:hypothetical protein
MALRICAVFRAASRVATVTFVAMVLCLSATGQQPASSAQPNAVLVELFTSEGCSDCPPADALLAKLDTQVFAGAHVIVLSEHVTYWNHLGWRDPFSLDEMDQRQESYTRQFGLDSPATPQFVVDGAKQVAGTNPQLLAGFITRAATTQKIQLEIDNAHRAADGSIDFSVRTTQPPNASLVAAIAENATHSEVSHGENAGRTLHHVAVVRVMKDFGSSATDGRPLQLSGADILRAEKDGEPIRLVVFLVSRNDSHVISAAEQMLNP